MEMGGGGEQKGSEGMEGGEDVGQVGYLTGGK